MLVVRAQFEELPVFQLIADSYEDEWRLRAWLSTPATRRRLLDAFDGFVEVAAA